MVKQTFPVKFSGWGPSRCWLPGHKATKYSTSYGNCFVELAHSVVACFLIRWFHLLVLKVGLGSHSFSQIWSGFLWEKNSRYSVSQFFFLKSVLQLFSMQLFPIYVTIVCWNQIEPKISAWCWEKTKTKTLFWMFAVAWSSKSAAVSLLNPTLGRAHTLSLHCPSHLLYCWINAAVKLIKTTSSSSLIRLAIMAAITALIGTKKNKKTLHRRNLIPVSRRNDCRDGKKIPTDFFCFW